jgi:PAS domain S-box-containing protein
MRSEREFSTLVENSPDIISRLDRELRYIYVSPNLERFAGVATETFIGKTPGEVNISGYDSLGFESSCREAITRKQTVVREFEYQERHFRTRIIPELSANGNVESVMSISEDFTERLRAETELRTLTARLFSLQDEERRRMARELHDGAAQNIFGITINLSNLQKLHDSQSGEADRLMNESQTLAEQSLTELRTLSYLLHPPILDHAGLVLALQWFAEGFSKRSGIYVDVIALEDIGRLPLEIETALFRIVQESLTNIRRHSGSESATIRLEKEARGVKLQISDRGHGMKQNGNNGHGDGESAELGVGIPGMRQRLLQLGGQLDIQSTNQGTTITAVVPTTEVAVYDQHSAG